MALRLVLHIKDIPFLKGCKLKDPDTLFYPFQSESNL
jgi:hypothetical protein